MLYKNLVIYRPVFPEQKAAQTICTENQYLTDIPL